MSLRSSASVCPSGQAIFFLFRDEATIPANVASLSDQREVQALTLSAGATGAPFTITVGGSTTAPIAMLYSQPPVFAQWAATVPAAGAYDLAINMPPPASYWSAAALYEVFGGDPAVVGSLVGTATVNMVSAAGNPATFQDGTVDRSGAPVNWMPLGRFTLPGKALAVRVSGPNPALKPGDPGALLYADALRIVPASGGAAAIVGPDEPPGSSASAPGPAYLQYYSLPYDLPGPAARWHQVLGAGGHLAVDPAAVQAALAALPNVGAGNVSCSGTGTAGSPLLVRYLGSFGAGAVPLATTSNAGIVVSRVAAGDSWPYIRINGGRPIKLANPYWGTGLGDAANPTTRTHEPYLPFVYFPLIQSAPAAQRERILAHLNTTSVGTGPGWAPASAAGYSLAPQASAGVGSSAKWERQGLPAGTYRLSATWPVQAGNTTDAVYTVTNRAGATLATYHASQAVAPAAQASTTPAQVIDNGAAGYSRAGAAWASSSDQGYGNTLDYVPPGDGSATADWAFTGLAAGTYTVSATWTADPNRASNAPYKVYDGPTALGSLAVNQRLVPAGSADQAGAPWFDLGKFAVSSGTLRVRVTNAGDGYVIADAIRVEPATPAASSGPLDDGVPWHVLGSVTLSGLVDDLIVTLTNGGTGTMIADGVRFERTSADTSVAIAAGDVVTYDAGVGWASTPAGDAPAASGEAVANLVGASLYPPVPDAPRTMALGWNVNNSVLYSPVMQYANLARVWERPGDALTVDVDGYPTTIAGPQLVRNLCIPPSAAAGEGRGWKYLPEGDYTVRWDGASNLRLSDGGGSDEVAGRAIITGGAGNRRTFTLRARGGNHSPVVIVVIESTSQLGPGKYAVDVRNLQVLPPGVDDTAPPKFTPGFLSKVASARSIRWLDPLRAIDGNGQDFEDYEPPQSRLPRFGNSRGATVPIAEIRGGSGFFHPGLGVIFQVTTTVPHGLGEGFWVTFPTDPGTAKLSDGSTFPTQTYGNVHVTSPTTFLYQQGPRATPPVTMTNVLGNVGGSVLYRAGNNMPLSDMIEACNVAGSDIYVNTSVCMTDDCCTKMGQLLGRLLKAGSKARVEFSNEVWNYFFPANSYCTARSHAEGLGDGAVPWMCVRAAQQWALIRAGMAAYGRGGDMIRVMGSQFSSAGVTEAIAAYCAAHGIGFDELATAPYIGNSPSPAVGGINEPTFGPLVDLLTTPQDLDLMEAYYTYSGYDRVNPAHRAALDAHGFQAVRLVTYEGGPSGAIPFPEIGRRIPSRTGERSHALHRHPRHFHLLHHILRQEQDTGMSLYHFYQLATEGDQVQVDGSFAMWSAYNGTDQLPGTGDPTLDADNVNTPDRMDLVKSEVGGAFDRWMSRALDPRKPAPTGAIPGRNGMIRATGYPRGAFRPTR